MFGIDEFTAVINPPEAAILAVGAAAPVPVLRDGELVAVPKMKITLTVDHRVLDGATAAAFLRDLKDILEAPLRIVRHPFCGEPSRCGRRSLRERSLRELLRDRDGRSAEASYVP